MDRRQFFTFLSALGLPLVASKESQTSNEIASSNGNYGVLVDVNECIGCRKCEWACNEENNLPTQTLESFEDKDVFAMKRRPDADHYTIVNQYPGAEDSEGPLHVKFQCLHCEKPACASACLVSAFSVTDTGSVIYNADRCMGCRYCMVACPFQIPAYEYDEALAPQVRKCIMCNEKLTQEGGAPACIEICPTQCLTYGNRDELLQLAKRKIEEEPDKYIDHVYGEHEVGGTGWMYISSVPFEQIGLPKVGNEAPPELTETIQHGIFKNFLPPVALFGVLGMITGLFGKSEELPKKEFIPIQPQPSAEPVRHKFFTPGVYTLLSLMGVGLFFALWRFVFGIGSVSNLNDQYPWGIWIAIDVATGVALAAGGFTTAALIKIFHSERYKAVLRPALLTALLGYTFVCLGLLVDLGRYYNIWHPMLPSMWSGNSVLFEVAMCVMFYLTVLYLEFIPIVAERFQGKVNLPGALSTLNRPVDSLIRFAHTVTSKVMILLVIAGVVLSCLHQSSLGSLMLIAPYKMHTLWFTPILPLLFLLSAIAVGFPMVIVESMIASKCFGRKPEMDILAPLSRYIPILLGVYLGCKLGDLAIREAWGALAEGSLQSILFMAEIGLGVALPMAVLCFRALRQTPSWLFAASLLVVFGVVLNRVNVFLIAYKPVYQVEMYIPAIGEALITVGLIAALILVYRVAVFLFPVIPATHEQNHS